ncbi:MAG TPA: HIT domain-containing protein [Longimicrobiales bacterium]|nr:HIT domain-containing protein [Longimicrobiales bacterium]
MVEANCVFCRIIGGEEMVSIVHEDDRAIAFLDVQPLTPGHTLIVSRDHYPTILDVPDDVAAHCIAVAKQLVPGIRRATGADSVNLLSANGTGKAHDVSHFHLHLIPVPGGRPFTLRYPADDGAIPSRSELDVMAARIGRAIQDRGIAGGAAVEPAG